MKIGIDVSMLVYVGSGVATYTYNLTKALLLLDKNNEYHLFYSSLRRPSDFKLLEELKKLGANIHSYRFPPKLLKFWWSKLHIIPIELFTGKMDYFHTSDFLRPPLLKGTAGMTTVHDLTWKIFPEWHTKEVVASHQRKLNKTIKYGDIIICPSENTKKDLLKLFPDSRNNKIFVIPEGVDQKFKPVKDRITIHKALSKYRLDKPYIIYIGAIEPRKNLIRLIKAYRLLINEKNFKIDSGRLSLVIGGRAGWKNRDVYDLVETLGLKDKVIFTGYVGEKDLPALYSAAECCCYVSLYEGFGLPPLEAQACGCPVVTSDNSSIKEVVDNSAVLVDPENEEEIKNGIVKAISEKDTYKVKGSNNSGKYKWETTAKEFLKLTMSNLF